ncbi:heavy metal translocating P-type ATPase [Chitinophaga polysaccharea]|nr:cation-translocating P-type ATPase [Chitinophaga polysaccharea]
MQKIKRFLLPAAIVVSMVLLINIFIQISSQWRTLIFILGGVVGTLPLIKEITHSFKLKKIDLGIPVLATIVILFYVKEFWIACVFMLVIILGNIFKEYILWKVEQSVKEISRSLPDSAFLKTDEIREIKIKDIRKDDTLIVKAGGSIPVDGILLSDEAMLDESVITGESRLITKKKGDHLVAGSINQNNSLEMQVVNTSESSTLAQIHKLVEEAQSHSTQLSRFTTKFAFINSAVALIGTILIYVSTRNLLQALAFWIALVPVVFAIIVPVATTIGISKLAKNGIMVKTGEALENLTRIDSIVFDKTGTLTMGAPEINKIIILDKTFSETSLLELSASVEKYSEHPLSRAFIQKATTLNISFSPVDHIEIIKGKGLQGICKGKRVLIGSLHLIQEEGFMIPFEVQNTIKESESERSTAIFVIVDESLAGVIFLADQLRDHIKETMAALKNMQMKLTMLTGDNKIIAEKVAHDVGITRFYAETLPQDKIKYIQEFKSNGEKVIMIGDGINDAPALSESNVGIAMGLRGTDITLNSAKVVLLNDNIEVLPYTLLMSKKVLHIIRLDLYLATVIHVTAACLSVAGIITILGSAVIHQVSSVLVLLNTLRLFTIRKP